MQYADSPSWLMRIQCHHLALVGLYVRDVAGLRLPADIDVPPLDPAVGVRQELAPLAGPEAATQWARWWRGELARQAAPGSGFCPPDARFGDGVDLETLFRACHHDAVRWSSDRDREEADVRARGAYPDAEGRLVRTVEEEVGRKARPFRLQVTELPVAGAYGRRVAPGHVVVSRSLRADDAAYREWLLPVLRDLV